MFFFFSSPLKVRHSDNANKTKSPTTIEYNVNIFSFNKNPIKYRFWWCKKNENMNEWKKKLGEKNSSLRRQQTNGLFFIKRSTVVERI